VIQCRGHGGSSLYAFEVYVISGPAQFADGEQCVVFGILDD
jgi:hypothetical protein